MTRGRKLLIGFAAGLVLAAVGGRLGFEALDRAYPPPLPERLMVSTEVVDRDGALLRVYATPDGHWRMDTSLAGVDGPFVDMLIAYEDKRFREHGGIDPWAFGRAAMQLIGNGRIVSGGSTLSMQLARLIEPRESRSFFAKARQVFRALQLERRLTKDQILERYLTLAPYGGNIEGVRAAAHAWFGKEPSRLTVSEAALLVALPQLPERRRPDRNPENARTARDRVLARMITAGLLSEREATRAAAEAVPRQRRAMPALAPHLADLALKADPAAIRHKLTLSRQVQEGLESVARTAAARIGPRVSIALVMADAQNGDVLGQVGSADYFDASRSGWIDMTRVARSPGSTLKPFIYGLGFEQGLIAQETIIEDRPADFGGYRPRNFDMGYQGDVSIREALQKSLNVPAVRLLDAVGPLRLAARFRQSGADLKMPVGEPPGLAIGLGGAGMTLRDLVQLYTGLANGGRARALRDGTETAEIVQPTGAVLEPAANWQIVDILAGIKPPEGAPPRGLAYKTGTSYGYRDAWTVGFDGRYVAGVWVGRPDSGTVPGLSGYGSAAPILFEAFARSGLPATAFRRPPAGAFRTAQRDLPVTLARFGATTEVAAAEPPPHIVFPPDGSRVELDPETDAAMPLVLKLQGGRAPFRWLANGKPLSRAERRRTMTWLPDGAGTSTLTVIDAAGRATSVRVVVE